MSKRLLKSAVISPAPLLHSFKFCCRFFSADDSLEGLIADQEIGDSIDAPQSSEQSFSARDLALLRNSICDAKVAEFEPDIIRNGEIPEFGVFVDLIKGLLKVNRWEDALLLSESLCHMDIQWLSSESTQKQS